jgi:hypothetical protein
MQDDTNCAPGETEPPEARYEALALRHRIAAGGIQPPRPPPSVHPEYEAFVAALLDKLNYTLRTPPEPAVQDEMAHLLHLLARQPQAYLAKYRVYFEVAFELLADDPPELALVRSIRADLEAAETRAERGLGACIIALCGPQPFTALLAGLVSIFILFCAGTAALILGHTLLLRLDADLQTVLPVLHLVRQLPLGPIVILMCAAFLGSLVSLLMRLRNLPSEVAYHPIQIYVATLFKPLVAIAFALFIYAVMKAGMVSFLGVNIEGAAAVPTLWVLGFLAGFSERFAYDFVGEAQGHLGGMGTDDMQ